MDDVLILQSKKKCDKGTTKKGQGGRSKNNKMPSIREFKALKRQKKRENSKNNYENTTKGINI